MKMPTTETSKPKAIRMNKLDLDAESRLIRAVKARMIANGELISAEVLWQRGYSQSFIKRFLSS